MVERMRVGDGDNIEEDLLRYFILGEGTVGAYTLSGQAGSRQLPDSYPATVGGDFSVNSCPRDVYSYLMNQDTISIPNPAPIPFPPFIEVPNTATRDVVLVLRGCGEWLQITLIEGGPGTDSATVQEIQPIVKQPPLSDPLPIVPIGSPTSGAIVGDFTLNQPALYDTGFYNVGVRPTSEDVGVGGTDPWGNPLSFTRQWQASLLGVATVDTFTINPARFDDPFSWIGDGVFFPGGLMGPEWPIIGFGLCPTPGICQLGLEFGKGHGAVPAYAPPFNVANLQAIQDMPTAVDGNFKVPTLRNVELTGPFFHNGGQATLEQVVEFYNRGGDFSKENVGDLAQDIHPLGLSNKQQKDLVAFLKALTDERVRCEQAPFDHPEIVLPNGAKGGNVKDDGTGQAIENFEKITAVGANGGNKCLKGFLE
jgi:hypothetical protein